VSRRHLIKLKLLFFTLFFVLVLRSLQLATTTNSRYEKLAERQFNSTFIIEGPRGEIVDSQDRSLAISVEKPSAFINPRSISNKKNAALKISKIIHVPYATVLEKVSSRKYFTWLKRFISEEEQEALKALKQEEIVVQFSHEYKRVYPNPYLLSAALGFVGTDGQGLAGVELKMNQWLKSEPLKMRMKVDGRGQPILIHDELVRHKSKINGVRLTIDSAYQNFVEEKLEETVQKFSARRGLVLAMDPHTGEIKAMAQYPRFDNNFYDQYSKESWKNWSTSWTFEPGSIFKPIALAYGLEEHLYGINDSINCRAGSFKIGRYAVKEADKKHQYENLRVWEIIQKSSNIGTSHLSARFNQQGFYEFLKKVGFGQKVSFDIAGEERGLLFSPQRWNRLTLSNLSFGQAISVTPIQLVRAYSAIANGGYLPVPRLISKVRSGARGEWQDLEGATEKQMDEHRIFSEDTVKDMTKALYSVTQEGGTATSADIPEVGVAGKTGTAQRAWENRRGYEPGKYVSSFIGFAPIHQANLVVGVFIDSPTPLYYGGVVAAPLFKVVMERYLNQNGLISQLAQPESKQQWGQLDYLNVRSNQQSEAHAAFD